MNTRITLLDVKQALKDGRFRRTMPAELQPEVEKYLSNPSCACNTKFYRRVLKECKEQLKAYFPGREPADIEKEVESLAQNHWSVINCRCDELEARLKKLPAGRKQLAIGRDPSGMCTCVVNELDLIW